MRKLIALLACSLVLGCSPQQEGADNPPKAAANEGEAQYLDKIPLIVRHGEGGADSVLEVELALTADQQAKGLMHRSGLQPGEGMLFPMMPPRLANFWMKDTPVALDIIFIRTDGGITRIVRGAKPNDRTPIFAEQPVIGVLELRGGDADALKLDERDRINWGDCVRRASAAPIAEPDSFCPA